MKKFLHKLLTKAFSIALVIMLVGGQALPYRVFAQEAPPDPAPTTDLTVTNDATQTTTADTAANTGGDVTETPAPTPADNLLTTTPDPSPSLETTPTVDQMTPTETPPADPPDSGISIDNGGNVESSVSAEANTGNNTIEPPANGDEHHEEGNSGSASTPSNQPANSVTTGDAVSITNVDNAVNTTEINSQVVYQTINLYVDQTGNIDLTLPSELARALIAQNPDQQTISAAVASVSNDAAVTNNVTGSSNTGGNAADGEFVTIHSGDAITLLSILNRINFVMIDSVVHVVIINIFGNLTGNIFLPDLPANSPAPCPECGSLTVQNGAAVTNNVAVTADSGNNTVTANSGTIATGMAGADVNIINLINTVLYGSSQFQLYILDHGLWNGSFLGWATADGVTSANFFVDPSATPCPSCIAGARITSDAAVTNNVNASATTGGNAATGNSAHITTGDAYSSAAILNLINTSFIRSFGFYGFINVLGSWTGDIGSKSLFPTPTPAASVASAQGGGPTQENGGLLEVSQTNNAGSYVLPGDTVTFFVTIRNPGNGRVFDSNLTLHLYLDGIDRGGTTIHVGNIKIGGTVKVSTGLVLSDRAPGGLYTAHAIVTGHVGPNSDAISAAADSTFTIYGASYAGTGDSNEPVVAAATGETSFPRVLGATNATPTNILMALLVLLLLAPEYVLWRLMRDRRALTVAFGQAMPLVARLEALRVFLL